MDLQTYIDCRNDEAAGQLRFVVKYVNSVVDGDEDYYQPILRNLLGSVDVPPKCVCLTDLCKASFVEQGTGGRDGCRGDTGNDGVVRRFWANWTDYVSWPSGVSPSEMVPYRWIWERLLQARFAVTLGVLAEYGFLKVFYSMATKPSITGFRNRQLQPQYRAVGKRDPWVCPEGGEARPLRAWIDNVEYDWWHLEDRSLNRHWYLLPAYHPSAANCRGCDPDYRRTAPVLARMIDECSLNGRTNNVDGET
jgi:hypothetical protein